MYLRQVRVGVLLFAMVMSVPIAIASAHDEGSRPSDGKRSSRESEAKPVDPDAETTWQALISGALPANVLRQLALHAGSADVRLLALQALAEDPEARTIATQASNDPHWRVRKKAREILAQLDAASQEPVVTFKDGRLGVRAEDLPLPWLLVELSRRGGVAIMGAEGLGDERISVQFQDLPLDEGLRQLLKGHDAFFFYGAEETAPASLKAVWVYPKFTGRTIQPVPPEKWASTGEIEAKLGDPSAEARSRAIFALVERKRDQALDAVLQALKDKDDQVRTRALYGAVSSSVNLPVVTLRELALHDRSPEVRFLALQALTEHPEGRVIAKMALNDPNPHVRRKAQEILLQLGDAPKFSPPKQPEKGQ